MSRLTSIPFAIDAFHGNCRRMPSQYVVPSPARMKSLVFYWLTDPVMLREPWSWGGSFLAIRDAEIGPWPCEDGSRFWFIVITASAALCALSVVMLPRFRTRVGLSDACCIRKARKQTRPEGPAHLFRV
jgi:hypothetical protein